MSRIDARDVDHAMIRQQQANAAISSLSSADHLLRIAWRLVPQQQLSRLLGRFWRITLPPLLRKPTISAFARTLGANMSEAEKPLGDYRSVHDFFTRRLSAEARPVCQDAHSVCSPVDGRIVETGQVGKGKVLTVKGAELSLVDLLADSRLAETLEGGPYLVVYLSPSDYHRVHSPLSGGIVAWHHVPGKLFSVNAASLRREPGLFTKNERLVTVIEGDETGPCACVMVAAFGVGNITLSCDAEVETHSKRLGRNEVRSRRFPSPPRVRKGDELGIFHLGSTVIVVFAPQRVALNPHPPGARIRVGQIIGRAASPMSESGHRLPERFR